MSELNTLEQVVNSAAYEDAREIIKKGAAYSKMWASGIVKYIESRVKPKELDDLSRSYPTYVKTLKELDLANNEVARKAFMLGTIRSVYDLIYLLEDDLDGVDETVTHGQKHLSTFLMLLMKSDMTPSDIAKEARLSKSNVSYVLKSIESHGLIAFKEYSKSKHYYITVKGRRFLKAKST